jgi:hypothetical protein
MVPVKTPRAQRPLLIAYARDALRILEHNLALHRQGCLACYRVIAVELRLLLCDTTRRHGQVVDISLAPRLLPGLRLHPLSAGRQTLFDLQGEPLPLVAWLSQKLSWPGGSQASLRDLIRAVVDQDGGAHVDLRAGADGETDFHPEVIVAIGEYVLGELRRQLAENVEESFL